MSICTCIRCISLLEVAAAVVVEAVEVEEEPALVVEVVPLLTALLCPQKP